MLYLMKEEMRPNYTHIVKWKGQQILVCSRDQTKGKVRIIIKFSLSLLVFGKKLMIICWFETLVLKSTSAA